MLTLKQFKNIDETKITRSYKEYVSEAKRIVIKFSNNKKLTTTILKSDYYLSLIVSWLMCADGTYDPNHAKGASNSTYRVYMGKHALYNILRELNSNKRAIYTDELEIYQKTNFVKENTYPKDFFRKCFKSKVLSKREKRILYMRLVQDKTYKEIGFVLNVSKQRIEQIYERAIIKIKKAEACNV